MRILVVDDSAPYRTQIRKALESMPDVTVVGTASNGRIALQMLAQKNFDLVTLDINMPEMDGLETLAVMKKDFPQVRAIMFAAQTAASAKDTIEALSLGASDFVVKPASTSLSIEQALKNIEDQLVPKVLQFFSRNKGRPNQSTGKPASAPPAGKNKTENQSQPGKYPKVRLMSFEPRAVVVASSTGGPTALESFLTKLNGPPNVPVFIAQHMPPTFTQFLAKRLSEVTGIEIREAQNGESPKSGTIYVAPGDWHMRLAMTKSGVTITLDQSARVKNVRPAADLLFETAADIYGPTLLGVVLTGMGDDGCAGAHAIKKQGGAIMIQDKESCVVWGMPAAVHRDGIQDFMASVDDCGHTLARLVNSSHRGKIA